MIVCDFIISIHAILLQLRRTLILTSTINLALILTLTLIFRTGIRISTYRESLEESWKQKKVNSVCGVGFSQGFLSFISQPHLIQTLTLTLTLTKNTFLLI